MYNSPTGTMILLRFPQHAAPTSCQYTTQDCVRLFRTITLKSLKSKVYVVKSRGRSLASQTNEPMACKTTTTLIPDGLVPFRLLITDSCETRC